jgi:hypothetical protein
VRKAVVEKSCIGYSVGHAVKKHGSEGLVVRLEGSQVSGQERKGASNVDSEAEVVIDGDYE